MKGIENPEGVYNLIAKHKKDQKTLEVLTAKKSDDVATESMKLYKAAKEKEMQGQKG